MSLRKYKKKIDKWLDDTLEFQPDSREFELRQPHKASRSIMYLLLLLLAAGLVWSCLAEVDRVVTARGKLISTGQDVVVQPLINSIIRSLDVQVGQVVKAGQTLATLDPTFSKSDVDQVQVQLSSLNSRILRLECELLNKPFAKAEDFSDEDFQIQNELLRGRREEYQARIRAYEQESAALTAAIASFADQLAQMRKQREIMGEIVKMRQNLYEQGADARVNFLGVQNDYLALQAQIEKITNNELEIRHSLAKIAAEKESFKNNWRNEISKELASLKSSRDSAQEQMAKARRYNELVNLTSPVDAVVLELNKYSVGSVVKEGEPIMSLVPLNVPVEAEVNVEARDIGYIRVGDLCRLKLDTFPFQEHGTLDGSVRTVSEDAFQIQNEAGRAYLFRTRIELKSVNLKKVPDDMRLSPGMTLTAEIKVGKRRVITFFIYPLIKAFDESFREP